MKLLLLLDYDGTLTPIVNRPELAKLSSYRRGILRRLSRSSKIKMAVISGRRLSDVKKLVGISRIIYVGNHGFEIEVRGKSFVFPAARRFIPVLKRIKAELARKVKVKGVLIEDKEFTLSIHYRLVAKRDLTLIRRLFKEVMKSWKKKVRITQGNKVIEIRPPFDWDKGHAVKWIISRLRLKSHLPVYIGDDRTDEDAFRVLKKRGITILAGEETKTAADYCLGNVDKVYQFLRDLMRWA